MQRALHVTAMASFSAPRRSSFVRIQSRGTKKRAETVQKLSPLWGDRHSATKVVIMTERFYEWRGKLPETHNTLSQQTEDDSNDL